MTALLYFVQAENGGPIKIGQTGQPLEARVRALQTGNPRKLVVLGTRPAFGFAESRLHRDLAEHRLEGEWFEDCPQVRTALAAAMVEPIAECPLRGDDFRGWLSARVADDPGKVSRRKLGRRLAAQVGGDPDVYRRTVRRILDGSISDPSQATRDSIYEALRVAA